MNIPPDATPASEDKAAEAFATTGHGEIGLVRMSLGRMQVLSRLVRDPETASPLDCTRAALKASIRRLDGRVFGNSEKAALADLEVDLAEDELRVFAELFLQMNPNYKVRVVRLGDADGGPTAAAESDDEEADEGPAPTDPFTGVQRWCVRMKRQVSRLTKIPGIPASGFVGLRGGMLDSVSRVFEATRGIDAALRTAREIPAFSQLSELSRLVQGLGRSPALDALDSIGRFAAPSLTALVPDAEVGITDVPPPDRAREALDAMMAARQEEEEALARRLAEEAADRQRAVTAVEASATTLAGIERKYEATLNMGGNLAELVGATRDLLHAQMEAAADAQNQALQASERQTRRQIRTTLIIAVIGWFLGIAGLAAVGVQIYLVVEQRAVSTAAAGPAAPATTSEPPGP